MLINLVLASFISFARPMFFDIAIGYGFLLMWYMREMTKDRFSIFLYLILADIVLSDIVWISNFTVVISKFIFNYIKFLKFF